MSEQKEKNMPEEKLPEAKLPESAPVSEGEALTALADAILATDEPEEIADVPKDDELEPTHGARGKKEKPEDTQKSREERLSNLIEKGKKAGKLTLKEIADVIDGLNLSQEQMDRFYDTLEEPEHRRPSARICRPSTMTSSFPRSTSSRRSRRSPKKRSPKPTAMVDSRSRPTTRCACISRRSARCSLLTPEEEIRSSPCAWSQGDEEAKRRMAEANLRLVVTHRQTLRRPRHAVPRSHSGGQSRPHQGRRKVRLYQGLQVLDLRHVVDPSGHHPRHRRPGAHDPHSGAYGRDDQQGHPRFPPAAAGAGPRPERRGDRRGDEHARGQGARHSQDRAGAGQSSKRRSARRRTPISATLSPTRTPPSRARPRASRC